MTIVQRPIRTPDTLTLDTPEPRWEYDPFLALREAEAMEATGRAIPRPIEELAEVNWEWEQSVYMSMRMLRWARDYQKLSPEQRAALEGVAEE